MNTNSNWALPVCLTVASVFGVTQVLMKRQGTMTEAAAVVTAGEADPVGPPDDETQPPAPPAPAPAAPKKQPVPPPAPRVPTRAWNMPAKPVEGLEQGDYDIVDLAVNEDGTRVLAKCKRQVYCFDTTTGRVLHTFLPPKRRWEYQKPDAQFLFLSRDARFVASCSESHSSTEAHDKLLTLQEAETGRSVGTLQLHDETDVFHLVNAAAYTASARTLVLPQHLEGELMLQTVSTEYGLGRLFRLPNGKKLDGHFRAVVPVPNAPVLIVYRLSDRKDPNPSGVSALDLRTGVEKPLTSFATHPWCRSYERGLTVSPDGKFVLVQGLREVQVSDWRANRRVFECAAGNSAYSLPHFTPDGRRVLVQKAPQFQVFPTGGPQGGTRTSPAVKWELHDLASGEKLSEYEPGERAAALAVSGDGKTMVYSHGTKVYALEFQAAFGVRPFPPAPRPDASRELPTD